MFVSKSLFSEGQEGHWGRCFLCPGRTVAGPEGGAEQRPEHSYENIEVGSNLGPFSSGIKTLRITEKAAKAYLFCAENGPAPILLPFLL